MLEHEIPLLQVNQRQLEDMADDMERVRMENERLTFRLDLAEKVLETREFWVESFQTVKQVRAGCSQGYI